MRNLICRLFGHKAPGYAEGKGWGGWEYAKVELSRIDGVGRTHARIYGQCARCEARFFVCAIHVPEIAAQPGKAA